MEATSSIIIPLNTTKKDFFPDTLSTDKRLSKKEIEIINNAYDKIDYLFKDFNQKVCSKCTADLSAILHQKINEKDRNRGCCALCGEYEGYFEFTYWAGIGPARKISDRKKQLEEIKKKYGYTKKYGFFDPKKKKCKLPRWRRSITCSSFCCINSLSEIALEILKPVTEIKRRNKIIH